MMNFVHENYFISGKRLEKFVGLFSEDSNGILFTFMTF